MTSFGSAFVGGFFFGVSLRILVALFADAVFQRVERSA